MVRKKMKLTIIKYQMVTIKDGKVELGEVEESVFCGKRSEKYAMKYLPKGGMIVSLEHEEAAYTMDDETFMIYGQRTGMVEDEK